jgi:hypothetical protein
MKCEAIQELLSRYLTDELSVEQKGHVQEHLKECVSCREALAFHRSLTYQMDAVVAVPPRLQDRVAEKIVAPRAAWLTRILGDPTMKKILISSTAATALVAAFLVMAPRSASASTPLEKFNKMRAAIGMAMENGDLTLEVTSDARGVVTVTGVLDGAPLPADFPVLTTVKRDGDFLDVKVHIDLSPDNYSTIRYGRDQNTLIMVPKANPQAKTVVGLDPKSMKPESWTTLLHESGNSWKEISRAAFKPTTSAKPTSGTPFAMNAEIIMRVGSNASIGVHSDGVTSKVGSKAPEDKP